MDNHMNENINLTSQETAQTAAKSQASQETNESAAKSGSSRMTALTVFACVLFLLSAGFIVFCTLRLKESRQASEEAKIALNESYYNNFSDLAENVSQLISKDVQEYVRTVLVAASSLTEKDLETEDSLQRFLRQMEIFCRANKLSLADENGRIYTRDSTYSGLSTYSFLQEKPKAAVVTTTGLYEAIPTLTVAVPISHFSFSDAALSVLFLDVPLDEMLSVSFFTNTSDTLSYGLFYKNGQPLTLSSFTVLPDDAKLFSDFEQGVSGEAVFSLNNSPAKIFYAPVDGTEWTAAVLVRP